MDAGESFAGTREEAGAVVVAGEFAAVEADAVSSTTGEGACSRMGFLNEAEGLVERVADVGLAPPPLEKPEPESEPESPAAELVAVGFEKDASPAPASTPVVSGLEGGA